MSPHRRVLTFVVMVVVAACGPFNRSGPPDSYVIFNNQSIDQASVYAVRGAGPEVRIGTVFSNRREALRVPSSLTSGGSDLQIVARTLASNRVPRTGPLQLNPGDTIEVTLPADQRVLTVLPPRNP